MFADGRDLAVYKLTPFVINGAVTSFIVLAFRHELAVSVGDLIVWFHGCLLADTPPDAKIFNSAPGTDLQTGERVITDK